MIHLQDLLAFPSVTISSSLTEVPPRIVSSKPVADRASLRQQIDAKEAEFAALADDDAAKLLELKTAVTVQIEDLKKLLQAAEEAYAALIPSYVAEPKSVAPWMNDLFAHSDAGTMLPSI